MSVTVTHSETTRHVHRQWVHGVQSAILSGRILALEVHHHQGDNGVDRSGSESNHEFDIHGPVEHGECDDCGTESDNEGMGRECVNGATLPVRLAWHQVRRLVTSAQGLTAWLVHCA